MPFRSLIALVVAVVIVPGASAGQWPQFRGPNGSGKPEGNATYPAKIGPETNVAWKTAVAPGHSSPVISEDRVFVTGVEDEKLLTMALDRASGKLLWKREAPQRKREEIHSIGSLAQASPATDGERVVSFFGSSGLHCYDAAGELLWSIPMGPFNNDFGAATSPTIVGDLVILCQDHDSESFLMAIDKRSGDIVWRTDRSEFARNFCTPVVWDNVGKRQLVVAATLRVVGYDLQTGKEAWTVRGISRTVCMSPTIGDDGTLYVAGFSGGGDPEDRIRLEPFEQYAPSVDKNKNQKLDDAEIEDGPIKQRFSQIDRDNDLAIDRAEYEYFQGLFEKSKNVILAIRPGTSGEATDTHVVWRQQRHVPFCASPLLAGEHLFTVKDGGIISSLNARTGELVRETRISATGSYYASPVAADGKVYLCNERGRVTVLSATGDWKVLHTADFADGMYATPALADGQIIIRTNGHLYCLADRSAGL